MSSKYSILQTSKLSDVIKSNTITQEVIRRLSNISITLDKSIHVKIIEDYIQELVQSRCCIDEIERAVTPGLVGFKRRVIRQSEGGAPVHRRGSVIKKSTFVKKLTISTDWYKKSSSKVKPARTKSWGKHVIKSQISSQSPTAPIFVSRTPGGGLRPS